MSGVFIKMSAVILFPFLHFFFFSISSSQETTRKPWRRIKRFTASSQKTLNASRRLSSSFCWRFLCSFHMIVLIIAEIIKGSACTCSGLRFLVRLCTDMGLKEVQDYATKLKKAEKIKEMREQVCRLQA